MKAKLLSTHDSQASQGGHTATSHDTGDQVRASVTSDPHTSRRGFVGGVLASALACSLSARAVADEFRPIKEAAAQKGILFGSSVGAGQAGTLAGSFHDSRYLEILKRECSVIVPENELKSYVIAIERDRYNFVPGDWIAGFARSSGIKLRGHTLLWNRTERTPKWLREWFGGLQSQPAERYLRDYIQRVCAHYGDQIHSWDVVNETIDPSTGQMRDTPFTRVLGFDVLRIVYEAARDAAPHSQLVYNDYMSWTTRDETHRAGVLRLLEKLKSRNIPVDALGVQSHLGSGSDGLAAQSKEWRAFVDEVVAMGYRLLITELDVNDKDMPADIKPRDTQVATVARDYLDIMLSYRELNQVLCWGMVDRYSWLQNYSPRLDKARQRPDPYDDLYQPKPLREAIAAAFAAAAPRA
jgi:endo-1,4-beta-xylanase